MNYDHVIYNKANQITGSLLEDPSRIAFRDLGFNVEEHIIDEPGVDVKAYNDKVSVAGECINWKEGSYINPKRWNKIVVSLMNQDVDYRFLFHCGVKLTKEQSVEADNLGIKRVYRKEQIDVDESERKVAKWIGGVITILLYPITKAVFSIIKTVVRAISVKVTCFKGFCRRIFDRLQTKFSYLCPDSLDSMHVNSKRGLNKMIDKYKEVIDKINIIVKDRLYYR